MTAGPAAQSRVLPQKGAAGQFVACRGWMVAPEPWAGARLLRLEPQKASMRVAQKRLVCSLPVVVVIVFVLLPQLWLT